MLAFPEIAHVALPFMTFRTLLNVTAGFVHQYRGVASDAHLIVFAVIRIVLRIFKEPSFLYDAAYCRPSHAIVCEF